MAKKQRKNGRGRDRGKASKRGCSGLAESPGNGAPATLKKARKYWGFSDSAGPVSRERRIPRAPPADRRARAPSLRRFRPFYRLFGSTETTGKRDCCEANFSTQQPAPQAHARISRPDADQGRPPGAEAASRQGTPPPRRLTAPKKETFPPAARLLTAVEFERVLKQGRRAATPWFTIAATASRASVARLGLTASKRVGTAVARNRARRCVREAFRRGASVAPPLDVVVTFREAAAGATFAELRVAFEKSLRELRDALARPGRSSGRDLRD